MKASDLFVKALENEGVEYIFGIPGEENLDFLNSLRNSSIKLILTRHEQGAGFMAATYGRLTGKVGVCYVNTWTWCYQSCHTRSVCKFRWYAYADDHRSKTDQKKQARAFSDHRRCAYDETDYHNIPNKSSMPITSLQWYVRVLK